MQTQQTWSSFLDAAPNYLVGCVIQKRERISVAFLQTNYTFLRFYSPLKTFKNSMLYSGKIWFMNNSFIRNVQYIDDDDVSVAIYVFEVLFFIRVLFLCMNFPVGKVILLLPDSLNIFHYFIIKKLVHKHNTATG